MSLEITSISIPFVFNVSVNCYLVNTGDECILIDTGRSNKRAAIERELALAGCRHGDLKLIILTHGDFDHSGNAAYLRQKFGAKVTMHVDDAGMVERGDMLWNRNKPNVLVRGIFSLLFRLSEADRFKPDFTIGEGSDLSEFGLEATIMSIPGHSKGSIGILTPAGDLFCGDLLANTDKPDLWSIIDDKTAAHASVEKLKGYDINMVYPGHGMPFPMASFLENYTPL